MADLKLAKVVNVNPKAHSADVVLVDDNRRIPNVRVLSAKVSTRTGRLGLSTPTPGASQYDVQDTKNNDVYACVGFFGRIPAILGFIVPEVCQMTFDIPGLEIDRHDSDVYSATWADGSWEKAWPNGLWLGVQTTPGHVDLTGKDFDQKWKIAENTDASYWVTLQLPGGAGKLQVDPQGNATITFEGAAALQAASWTIKGPATFTDPATFDSTVTASGDVKAGTVSLVNHVHTKVSAGTALSGAPQA